MILNPKGEIDMVPFRTNWFLAALVTYRIYNYGWRIWKFVAVVCDILEIRRVCKKLSDERSIVVKGIWKEGIEERA